MTRSDQCKQLGRLLGAYTAKTGKRVSAATLGNVSMLPSAWRAHLRMATRDMLADPELAEMMVALDAEPIGAGPATLPQQSAFWLGYNQEQAVRRGMPIAAGKQPRNQVQRQYTLEPSDVDMLEVLARSDPKYKGKASRVIRSLIRKEFALKVKAGEITEADFVQPPPGDIDPE